MRRPIYDIGWKRRRKEDKKKKNKRCFSAAGQTQCHISLHPAGPQRERERGLSKCIVVGGAGEATAKKNDRTERAVTD